MYIIYTRCILFYGKTKKENKKNGKELLSFHGKYKMLYSQFLYSTRCCIIANIPVVSESFTHHLS